jgi:hypothetical protein
VLLLLLAAFLHKHDIFCLQKGLIAAKAKQQLNIFTNSSKNQLTFQTKICQLIFYIVQLTKNTFLQA